MNWFEYNNMKANANKFQLMFLSRNNVLDNCSIMIEGTEIKASDSINILGVELDQHLKLNMQIDEICNQTGKQINALKRIRHNLDKDAKNTIYNSYISSNFNYCSIVWMFANKTQLEKLENTNKRALRFATDKGYLSYEELCKQEKQLSVFKRCVKNAAILLYKVRKDIAPKYLNELFETQNSQYEMRDNDRLSLPSFNTVKYGKNSFMYWGAKLWNNIPDEIKRSISLNTFKTAITQWLLTCDMDHIM